MLLVKHEFLPPARWLLGRTIACNRGKDDLLRSIRVKTAISKYKRPITQIVPYL